MNDDALNRGHIYKFLSNFYFLLLFPGFWHRSWQCCVCLSTGQGDGGGDGAGGEAFCDAPPSLTTVLEPPILKMKNSKKILKLKAQPCWAQQRGVWLGLTQALFPVRIKSSFHFLLEATSRAIITTVTRGRGKRERHLEMQCPRPPGPSASILADSHWALIPQLAHCSGRACRVAPP